MTREQELEQAVKALVAWCESFVFAPGEVLEGKTRANLEDDLAAARKLLARDEWPHYWLHHATQSLYRMTGDDVVPEFWRNGWKQSWSFPAGYRFGMTNFDRITAAEAEKIVKGSGK